MTKTYKKTTQLLFFAGMLVLSLTFPSFTLKYAKTGLQIWYKNMVPALLPMMIITGCMVKLNMTASFASILYPLTKKMYHLSKNGTYALIVGFLCGFPMGAKIICELYMHNKISKIEADTLLPICNNIGPIFMLTYGLKYFPAKYTYFILILFYAIPLVYALFLFRNKNYSTNPNALFPTNAASKNISFSIALDEAISDSAAAILSLGGYIIFFSIVTLIPLELMALPNKLTHIIVYLLEITNGLSYENSLPPYILLAFLQFGGICCLFQTIKFTSKTDLNINNYLIHKIKLAALTFLIFYIVNFLFF